VPECSDSRRNHTLADLELAAMSRSRTNLRNRFTVRGDLPCALCAAWRRSQKVAEGNRKARSNSRSPEDRCQDRENLTVYGNLTVAWNRPTNFRIVTAVTSREAGEDRTRV